MIKTNISKTAFTTIACLMLMTGVVSADTKVKTRQTSGGQSMENTSYIKGKRQRTEMNNGQMVTVQQCDLRRNLQIVPQSKAYIVQPYDVEANASTNNSSVSQSSATTKGGVVTSTITIRDTGERKQMFGYTARHLITTMVTESTPNSCSPTNSKMEFDGWYIDAAFALDCGNQNSSSTYRTQANGGCQDRYQTKQIGTAKRGYPVWEKTTMFDAHGAATYSTLNEVVEISEAVLDAALFDVPAGYREVKDYASLYATTNSSSSSPQSSTESTSDNDTNKSANQTAPEATKPREVKKTNVLKRVWPR